MDGLEFTRAVMDSFPRPILVVNISEEPGSPNIFRLLEAGAVDVYSKPTDLLNGDLDRLAQDLASKIRILAGVCVFRRRQSFVAAECSRHAVTPSKALPPSRMKIVVIGASTGGPQALRQILSKLPASFPLPVVCIQHIGSNFLSEMIAWIAEVCVLTVRKAVKGELPQPGIIYFAPADTHLEFDESHHFSLSLAALVNGHRPSVTATMRAAAHAFGAGCTGVLLTGMGCDGAEGMASISVAGGITIAQDEASSVVYGMPGEAVARGVVQHLLPLELIAPALINLLNPESALRNKSLIGLGG
jgi:two-component system chemotaxis response regulator CheB